jgi:ubiquinone/menaquinone biosynthesis C-methylase UbiE
MSGWTKKRRLIRRYDLTASIYDMRYAEEQKAKIEAALKKLKLEHSDLVLDVGCGTGILFDYVADRSKMIVGLDLSKKTLVEARAKRIKRERDNVHLVQADADNMPFVDNEFDDVFAITVLQNAPNPKNMLREIRRVAKNEAAFVLTGLKSIFSTPKFRRLLEQAGLVAFEWEDEHLKCFVAICRSACR